MVTYYCPHCWTVINKDNKICPNCGYNISEFLKSGYEDKLLAALHHSVSERKIMAAQILGIKESQRALPEFLKIITSGETDYYFLRAVLLATAKINHPNREVILQKAAKHPSRMVSDLANDLLKQLEGNHSPDTWDKHTG